MDATFAGLYGLSMSPWWGQSSWSAGRLVVQRTEGASSDVRRGGNALDEADDALEELEELTDEAEALAEDGSDGGLSAAERETIALELAEIEGRIGALIEDTRWAFTPLLDGSEDIALTRGSAEMTVSLGDLSLEAGDSLDDAEDFAERAEDYADYRDALEEARDEVADGEDFLDTPTATSSVSWVPSLQLPAMLASTVSQIEAMGTLTLLGTHQWSIAG